MPENDPSRKPHGGKRPGAGRKPSGGPEAGAKQMVSLRLAPDVVSILDAQANQTAYVETAVREKHARDTPPA